jgi:cytochrome c
MRGRLSASIARLVLVLIPILATACSSGARREAAELTGGDPDRGADAIGRYGCSACHTIPGIQRANAQVGPSLERIAGRYYLAGQLHNTPSNMVRWIQHPQQVERGTAMPEMGVTDSDARDIAAYLYTLR